MSLQTARSSGPEVDEPHVEVPQATGATPAAPLRLGEVNARTGRGSAKKRLLLAGRRGYASVVGKRIPRVERQSRRAVAEFEGNELAMILVNGAAQAWL
jgi:hypothetical protein